MTAATPTAARANGIAVAGFVCGLLGAVFSWLFFLFFPLILDILGIVFGVLGRRNAAAGARQGGLATAGLILGILGAIVFVLLWVLAIASAAEDEARAIARVYS